MANKKKTFKKTLCPVCGKYYFLGPDDEDNVTDKDGNYIERCNQCGWFYDLEQTNDPKLSGRTNKLCLNDYKEQYLMKLAADPDYDFLGEVQPPPKPHLCPVCGEHTFPDIDSLDICHVCGWQDDGIEDGSGPNILTLEEARAEFQEQRKNDPSYKWIDKAG